jgi:hypothetical protein
MNSFVPRLIKSKFRQGGYHIGEVTHFDDGTTWVTVPPWEVPSARRFAKNIIDTIPIDLRVFPIPSPLVKRVDP